MGVYAPGANVSTSAARVRSRYLSLARALSLFLALSLSQTHTNTHTAFLNELYKALNLNTVGGDAAMGAEVDATAKTALVEFRTVKEASLAKNTLVGCRMQGAGCRV